VFFFDDLSLYLVLAPLHNFQRKYNDITEKSLHEGDMASDTASAKYDDENTQPMSPR
jgi:hypothetical protein